MARVILVGRDAALLEGLAQSLLGFDHEVLFAATIPEIPVGPGTQELIVVSTESLVDSGAGTSIPLSAGSALIVYGTSQHERPFLSPRLQRATLAYLVLPLERHRLVALAHSFDTRARTSLRALREERDEDADFQL